jgi:serine/threonine protein kinase
MVVMEHCGTDLFSKVAATPETTSMEIRSQVWQLMAALQHIHGEGVLHGDLSTSNMFLSPGGELRVGDFGQSILLNEPAYFSEEEKRQGVTLVTLSFRPPELLLGGSDLAASVDMWASGCVLFNIVERAAPFPGAHGYEVLLLIFRQFGIPTRAIWPAAMQMPHWHRFPSFRKQPLEAFISTERWFA